MTKNQKQKWNIQQSSKTKWHHANSKSHTVFTDSTEETLLETSKLPMKLQLHHIIKNQAIKKSPNTSDVHLKYLIIWLQRSNRIHESGLIVSLMMDTTNN